MSNDTLLEEADVAANGVLIRAFLESPLAKACKKAGLSLTLADYLNWKSTLKVNKEGDFKALPRDADGTPAGFREPASDSTASMHKERWEGVVSKAKARRLNNWQRVMKYLTDNGLKVKGNSIAEDVANVTDYNHQNALIQMEG